jgi:integrase
MRTKGMWVSPTEFVQFGEPSKSLSDQIATRGRSIDFYGLGMYLPNPDPVLKALGKDIKEAVKGLGNQRTGKPLARATKNRCIWVLKLMFDYWISQGIVKTNPTDSITKYSDTPESPRGALPREIRAVLFPPAYPDLLKVWGSPMWAAFFGMMNDTGARNGEPRSLKWGELDLENEFIPLMKAIEGGKVATVKETKNGKEKPGWPSPATIQALKAWHALTKFPAPEDWVFTYRKNAPVSNNAVEKAFRVALKNLELDGNGWTPYWLRHTFVTYGQETLTDDELRLLAGDANRINGYKHPDATALYRKGASAKKKLDEARNGSGEKAGQGKT